MKIEIGKYVNFKKDKKSVQYIIGKILDSNKESYIENMKEDKSPVLDDEFYPCEITDGKISVIYEFNSFFNMKTELLITNAQTAVFFGKPCIHARKEVRQNNDDFDTGKQYEEKITFSDLKMLKSIAYHYLKKEKSEITQVDVQNWLITSIIFSMVNDNSKSFFDKKRYVEKAYNQAIETGNQKLISFLESSQFDEFQLKKVQSDNSFSL